MSVRVFHIVGFLLLATVWAGSAPPKAVYMVGMGRGDVTGSLETNMMGYASATQTSNGIHNRQWARAFVFAHPADSR